MGFWQGAANLANWAVGSATQIMGHGQNQNALRKCRCGHHENYHW